MGVPEMKGAVWSAGGMAETVLVGDEVVLAEPPPGQASEFEAVTCTRTSCPRSPPASVYVEDVAPAMAWHAQPPAPQSCHW